MMGFLFENILLDVLSEFVQFGCHELLFKYRHFNYVCVNGLAGVLFHVLDLLGELLSEKTVIVVRTTKKGPVLVPDDEGERSFSPS